MRQLLYISTGCDIDGLDLAEILSASERNNARDQITGFLVFNGRNFLQFVEGAADRLGALLERLHGDARHSGLVVLEDRPLTVRTFPEWSMRHVELREDIPGRRNQLEAILPGDFDVAMKRIILNFAALN